MRGAFRGTLAYAAPEVARSEGFDGRADDFALAASMLHVVTGIPLRETTGAPAVMLVDAGTRPLDASHPWRHLARKLFDHAIAEALLACLAFDPVTARPKRRSPDRRGRGTRLPMSDSRRADWALDTLCIHAGQEPDPIHGAVMTPIVLSTTFAQDGPRRAQGAYDYSRAGQPDARRRSSSASRRSRARSTASPSAAAARRRRAPPHAQERRPRARRRRRLRRHLPHLRQGAEAVRRGRDVPRHERSAKVARGHPAERRGSSGWRRRATRCSRSSTSRRSPRSRASAARAARGRQHVRDADAPAAARARRAARRALDDQVPERPLRRGRRRGRDERRRARRALHFLQKSVGGVPSPFDCYLVLRGLKTLGVRMRQHVESARDARGVAREAPAGRARVRYPGLTSHRGTRSPQRQMKGPGRDDQLRARGGARRRHARSSRRCASSPAPRASAASSRSPSTRPS